jgi:uncharacterized protein YprB with RNaseH-like and TPR domain
LETKQKLTEKDALYFHNNLPSKERWRMFGTFYSSVAYIDIETTGLYGFNDIITTIALYDGDTIKHYVHGKNLDDFKNDIKQYKLLVTYNGTNFDLPFIRSFLGISIKYAHIDLRYILQALGYTGGLKGCEKQIGLTRSNIVADIDGEFAVYLWKHYQKYKKKEALHTLLSYNIEDVLSLEYLMIFAYNKKISELTLAEEKFYEKTQPENPFMADKKIINEIKNGLEKYGCTYLTNNQRVKTNEPSLEENMYMIANSKFFDSFYKETNNKHNIPSKAKVPWVHVKSTNENYPETIQGKGGKWLIFIPEEEIDVIWQKIRKSILKNKLVKYAKCSTIVKNKYSQDNKRDCVICIYTYDYTDKVDVRIVRYKLKKLGFRDKIYYKTDISTLEKKYKNNGKSWLYSE